jgi:hypothetical protein
MVADAELKKSSTRKKYNWLAGWQNDSLPDMSHWYPLDEHWSHSCSGYFFLQVVFPEQKGTLAHSCCPVFFTGWWFLLISRWSTAL